MMTVKAGPPLADWLSLLEAERQALIVQLRAIERVLVKHGRLRRATVPGEGDAG